MSRAPFVAPSESRYLPLATMQTADAVAHVTAFDQAGANDPDRLATITAELERLDALTNALHTRRSAIYHAITGWRDHA